MKRKQDGFDEAMDDIQRQKRLTVAAPQMLEALKKAYTCMSIPDHIRSLISDAIFVATMDPEKVKGEEAVTKQELKCPKCRKSDKIVVRCQKGPGGDWHVYDCERCDREVHAERVK